LVSKEKGISVGFKKDWDLNSIKHQIWLMRAEMNSGYNDGWTAWSIKQEMYQLKWLLDESLVSSGEFHGEEAWLKEQEQNRLVKILKNERL